MAMDEVTFGDVPSRDGGDYDPGSPTPTFERVLSWAFGEGIGANQEMVVVAIGNLGSPGAKAGVSGLSTITDLRSLVIASRRSDLTLTQRWERIFNPVTPFNHIQAIVIRPL